jgi:hypothetical protein
MAGNAIQNLMPVREAMSERRIEIGEPARDFTLEDTRGQLVKLSAYAGVRNVYLVLNRGFA